jgi:hypothetical protein
VAHGVEDHGVQHVLDHRVVEGVAGDVVGRFQDRRRDTPPAADGAGWQEGPQHLGGQSHGRGADAGGEPVAVGALGGDQHGEQMGEHPAAAHACLVRRVGPHRQHAQPLRAVDQRHPDDHAVVGVGHPRGEGAVRPAGRRVGHRQRLQGLVQRDELPLLQVDEVDQRAVQAERRSAPVRQGGQFDRQGRLRLDDQLLQPTLVDGGVGADGRLRWVRLGITPSAPSLTPIPPPLTSGTVRPEQGSFRMRPLAGGVRRPSCARPRVFLR